MRRLALLPAALVLTAVLAPQASAFIGVGQTFAGSAPVSLGRGEWFARAEALKLKKAYEDRKKATCVERSHDSAQQGEDWVYTIYAECSK